jgi:hypothetical protein
MVAAKDDFGRLHELRKLLERMDRAYAKVGVLAAHGGAERPDGGDLTLIEIATIHEYGEGDIPERSFIRQALLIHREQIGAFCARLVAKVIARKLTPVRALEILGAYGAGLVKKLIVRGDVGGPDLAPSTIEAKGSSKKLIDTGVLVGVISSEVVP